MDDQGTNRASGGMMEISPVGTVGALLVIAGLFFGHGLAIAGSILVGSVVIARELSKK